MHGDLLNCSLIATPKKWKLRTTPEDRDLIERTISICGLTNAAFFTQAARAAARDFLVGQAMSRRRPSSS